MQYPHRIRLRGPWDFEIMSGGSGEPPLAKSGRVQMPTDWCLALGAGFLGRVRFRRFFNCPTGLEPHEAVWLIVEGIEARVEISLNGQPLGTADDTARPMSFDVTQQLAARNELWLEVECGASPSSGPIGEVRLEIRPKE
jgi:beta-galactosidase/beta-glucuronidase